MADFICCANHLCKLRRYVKEIASPETNLEFIYKKYKLHLTDKQSDKQSQLFLRAYTWLYEIRYNNKIDGLKFIDFVVKMLMREAKKDLNAYQDEIIREMLNLYVRERNNYLISPKKRGYDIIF